MDNEGYIQYWIIEETLKAGGNTLANGLYANSTTLKEVAGGVSKLSVQNRQAIEAAYKAQGYNNVFFFEDGFTYAESNDVGIYEDGTAWTYADADALPVTVAAGTVPSEGVYELAGLKEITVNSFADLLLAKNITSFTYLVSTSYHTSIGDGGSASYVRTGQSGTPSTGNEFLFYDFNGDGWAIKHSHIKSAMFGNDITKLEDALNAVSGGMVTLEPTTYVSHDLEILIPSLTTLNLNGAYVEFSKTGGSRGFVLNGDKSKIHSGTIRVTGTPSGGGGASASCISAGSQGTGSGFKGLKVDSVDVDTVRVNGNGIVLFGENRKCEITNVSWPDSATMGRVVATEWGGTDALTQHPHDNVIKNISGGKLTGGLLNSFVVWVSSAFNTEVKNVYSPDCYGLVGVFTGDKAAEHADPDTYKALIGQGIEVANVSGLTRQYGVRVYGKGSDVAIPLSEKPTLTNVNIKGSGGSDTEFGILIELTSGVLVNNPTLSNLGTGLLTGQGVSDVKVVGGEISYNRRNGVKFGNISGVSSCHIDGAKIHHNNQAGGAGVSSAAGVALAYAKQCSVVRCNFGLEDSSDETQLYSIFVEPNCENCDVSDNHTFAMSGGGTSIVNGSSTSYEMNTTGNNNTVESGLTLSGGAPLMTYSNLGRRSFMFSGSTGEPASGTWQQGDKFEYSAPLVSGATEYFIGKVYASGAWRNYGKIV